MLLYHPSDLSMCLKRLFPRIFSHCEFTAFNSNTPKAFIFIYLRIPIIAILRSRNPEHFELLYRLQFCGYKSARMCRCSTALRTSALWRVFPQCAHKNLLDFSTPTIPSDYTNCTSIFSLAQNCCLDLLTN